MVVLAVLAMVAGAGAAAWLWHRDKGEVPRGPAPAPTAAPRRPMPFDATPAERSRPARAGGGGAKPGPEHVETEDVEELLFWLRLFAPLRDVDPGIRERAMLDLASRAHQHPTKGKQFFDRATLQRHYERTARLTIEALLAKRRDAQAEPALDEDVEVDVLPIVPVEASAGEAQFQTNSGDEHERPRRSEPCEPRPVADEVFWFNLLAPLRAVAPNERRAALVALGARPHHHPLQGHRLFDLATLERELAWVVDADPDRLHERWHAAAFAESGVDHVDGAASSEPFDGLEALEGDELDLALESRLASVTTVDSTSSR